MRKLYLMTVGLFLLLISSFGQNHPVTVQDGFFYLNGEKFFVKGLGIEIVRPGQEINSEVSHNPDRFRSDITRFLGAGFNTIRTWGAQTQEQLEAVKDLDMKIIMGIWIPPHVDYAKNNFIDSSLQKVTNVLSYSKDYDNIIAYVIMNEPNTQDLVKNYDVTRLLYKTIVDEIHNQHPGTPVGMSAFPNISYLDMDMFDFIGYNVHPATNTMQDFCYDYPAYINYLKQVHGANKPLIVTEYGVSVSPLADNLRFPGDTQEERQANGLLYMYRSLIDGNAGGGCIFLSADGWYPDGDVNTNSGGVGETCGLIAYEDVTDMIGTPRPAWYAIKQYNTAVINSPKNMHEYQNEIPIEIFSSDTIDHFSVKSGTSEILLASIKGNYYSDTIVLNSVGMNDNTFSFTFFDIDNNVVKEESM